MCLKFNPHILKVEHWSENELITTGAPVVSIF